MATSCRTNFRLLPVLPLLVTKDSAMESNLGINEFFLSVFADDILRDLFFVNSLSISV